MVSENPRVSLIVLSYNQERFIENAVAAALAQDYANLELIFSDDCSSDGTWDIICTMIKKYSGPHRVVKNRMRINSGICAHVRYALALASGEIIVISAGDDYSLSNRISRTVDAFGCVPGVTMVESRMNTVDPDGNEQIVCCSGKCKLVESDPNKILDAFPQFVGAALAFSRSVIDRFPSLPNGAWAEDIIMSYRACLIGKVVRIDEPLLFYRTSGGVSTARTKTIEKSLSVNRGRVICYQQLLEDVCSLHRTDLSVAEGKLKNRIVAGNLFVEALGSKFVFTRMLAALKLVLKTGVTCRNLALLILSPLALSVRNRLYSFLNGIW